MLQRSYRVEFETDLKTKQVSAKLPTLNHTADFGDTAEEALANLRKLATGLIEVLLDEGKEIPPSDKTEKGGVLQIGSPQYTSMAIATSRSGH